MGAMNQQYRQHRPAVSLIIPCCNEEAGLATLEAALLPVIAQLSERGPVEVILIDDGSTDSTWSGLKQIEMRLPEVHLIRHPMNYGLGAALRTGFAHARGDVVVTTDADGTYSLAEIPALLARLTPEIAIVTASPYHPDGGVDGVPAWRLIFSRGASLCYRMVLGRNGSPVHTYTSLFRAYRCKVLPYIMPEHEGFLAVAEILVRATLAGYSIAEYPTILRTRRYGQSKARVVRITLTHIGFLTNILLHRVHVRSAIATHPTSAVPTSREAAGD